jgi:hypothetical protein
VLGCADNRRYHPEQTPQLAEQARNCDHPSSDPCSEAKKQQKITQQHRHVSRLPHFSRAGVSPELCRAGTFFLRGSFVFRPPLNKERRMNELIYLIGVILAVLSFFDLR